VLVRKADFSEQHVLFIEMAAPVINTTGSCTSNHGVVVLDSHESAKAALAIALTAQVSGKKFRCYINTNTCSQADGSVTTYPVCTHYPSLVN
jgi:hypothetical protein